MTELTLDRVKEMAKKSGNSFPPTDPKVLKDLKRLQKKYLRDVNKSNNPSKVQTLKNNFFRFLRELKRRGLNHGLWI
jgi:hypothetical protein